MNKYFRLLISLCGLILVGGVGSAAAASSSTSAAVNQSYNAGPSVLPSMLVELTPKSQTTVTPLTGKDIAKMLGVVVPINNATAVLEPQSILAQQVIVAADGRYSVLVTNENGPIKAGDYLTVSSLPGITMKADTSQSLIVGRAVDDFGSSSKSLSTVSLKNPQNHTVSVAIGRIAVNVQLAPNPMFLKSSNSIIGFLTRAEYSVTNKTVSAPRTYLSSVVFLATLVTTVIVLYSGTRTAIIASSRNPLAKPVIGRSLIKTILAALIVFAIGTFGVYLILNH